MTEKIGFIGLGIMGRGMVHNLLKAGFSVTVWNRTASRMDEFVAAGAKAAGSPRDVAENSAITMICVSNTDRCLASNQWRKTACWQALAMAI